MIGCHWDYSIKTEIRLSCNHSLDNGIPDGIECSNRFRFILQEIISLFISYMVNNVIIDIIQEEICF
jgi:hypothetical protein